MAEGSGEKVYDMKIAFLLNRFPVLSETFILNQITGLVDRGHDVDILASSHGDESKVHGDVLKYRLLKRTFYYGRLDENMPSKWTTRVTNAARHVLSCPQRAALLRSLNIAAFGKEGISLKNFYRVLPFFGRGEYDIIHCHFGPLGNLGAVLKYAGALSGKLVTTFHGYDMASYLERNGRNAYDFQFRMGSLFMPVSNVWKEKLISHGCNEEKICVHRMGIDTGRINYTPRYQKGGSAIRLLSVARLIEKKGIRYGISAAARAMKVHQNLRYTIIGDGPLRKELEDIVRETGVGNRIEFLGWRNQEEIGVAMAEADMLLAPSVTAADGDREGIPVVLMEAMARGMPVLSTNHSGIPELVEDGVSGFTVPERDADALADRLLFLMEHSEIWPEMGFAGRKRIEEEFDINILNDRLVNIYRSIK